MKHLLPFIFFVFACCQLTKAQSSDTAFAKQWKVVDSFIVIKSLPKSALAKVNTIYTEAKKRNLPAQVIKALLYKLSLQDKTNDDDINATVSTFNKEISAAANTVEQSILNVLLAETLAQYYSNNQWRLNQRSTTANFKKQDITTWGKEDFFTAVDGLYKKALAPLTALQQTNLSQYSAIIMKGNAEKLRPTLYDLLANMALDFYKEQSANQTKPVIAFILNDSIALAPVQAFIQHTFITADTTSFLLKALRLYQQVLQFHTKQGNTDALIDADVARITWVYENATFGNKEGAYKNALTAITQHYSNNPQAAQAWYLLISLLNNKAEKYNAFTDTASRYLLVSIRQMIKARLAAQPAASEGNSNMQELLQQIEVKELRTQAESVNVPGLPFRIMVQYKNVDTFYGRLLDKTLVDKLRDRNDTAFWKELARLPYTNAFSQPLPQTNDYRQHKVEIKMGAMPAGQYVLFAGNTKSFTDTARLLTQDITLSHLAYINRGDDYYVVDRESGRPLEGVKAKVVLHFYNSSSRDYEDKIIFNGVSGKQGHFKAFNSSRFAQYGTRLITLTDGNDTWESSDNNNAYNSYDNTTVNKKFYEDFHAIINFYTDRAIYRPGQKLYFKGVATTEDSVTQSPKLYLPKDSIKVFLYDVNGKTVDSVKLKINEYGSLTGSFILPARGLTGNFSISTKNIGGRQYFSVEEYKRPTFYVQLDTLKSAYRLNDSITVTGFAQAFAGNFLNNATVKYNVQRKTRYIIYDWRSYRYPTRNNNTKQITEGTITTDGSGRFRFTFKAEPDEMVDTSTSPVFDYSINIAATDAGGETREANTSLSVGYTSLTVAVNTPAVIERKAFTSIPVNVENLGGKPIDANVRVTVYPLVSPGRAVRTRYWDRPDVFAMSKEDFIKNFPYDEYENESDVHTWQKGTAIVNDTFNSKLKAYSLQLAAIPQGWYAIEASTTDKDGGIVKTVSYTEVYDASTPAMPSTDDKFSIAEKQLLHPGETASLIIGSGFNDVYVLQQVNKPGADGKSANVRPVDIVKLDNNKRQVQLPVTEAERGGIGIYYAFVKHNRFYNGGEVFAVPFDNKQLNVRYTTYRNKTEPGSKEQWTVQVKGSDSANKPAELLTAMYDASLDEFVKHNWFAPNLWREYYGGNSWTGSDGFDDKGSGENEKNYGDFYFEKAYSRLAKSGEEIWNYVGVLDGGRLNIRLQESKSMLNDVVVTGYGTVRKNQTLGYSVAAAPQYKKEITGAVADVNLKDLPARNNYDRTYMLGLEADSDSISFNSQNKQPVNQPLQLRTNFNETAFFFPQLYPDKDGNYTLQFTIPESLTRWKWISLAHTKDLAFGTNEQSIITQKTLMVQPNMPRFLREGDQLELTARISNTGDTALTGTAELQLVDAQTGNPVDGSFHNVFPNQYFTTEAGQTTVVKFPVAVPFNYTRPLTYRIIAKTTRFNDGEENTVPVLTNRMLVTESLPLYIKGDTTKHFTFDKLLNSTSETLQTQSLTIEYTANPIWNAIQALPYLIEYPYECAEQTFNRFYANALAANIVAQHPRIKQVFEAWLKASPMGGGLEGAALLSNLEKNQELKQIILEETPWVLNAQNEAQQKKNMALLFDMVKMAEGAQNALQKLQDAQLAGGGFAWFKGGYADRYITQYILTGIGRLQQMGAVPQANTATLNNMLAKGLRYLDGEAIKDYNELVKNKVDLSKDQLSQTAIQYLYMRSYFTTIAIADKKAYNYYYQQAMKYWQNQSEYMKGMISMALLRTNQQAHVAGKIYPSIIENAVTTPERGMYWKDAQWGYYWYQSPIEQQALFIELAEGLHKKEDASEMRTWLINQKQTTNWKTTKATADAIYALLLNNSTAVEADRKVTIQLGSYTLNSSDVQTQAGTGYFKKVLPQAEVKPAMGDITVTVQTPGSAVKNTGPSYGAVYWQYFEDMDKITQGANALSLHKKLFVERNTAAGKVLTPVDADSVLHVGDKVIMRIELKTDRNLEYIHLKDMRAAAMEPVNVLSEYKWQDGLGYYESTKDVATDFFISYMQKGTYVFEYPVYITHTGTFSAGIANVQCMYAPEFTSHSEGVKIVVE